jgi:hypothetical protein
MHHLQPLSALPKYEKLKTQTSEREFIVVCAKDLRHFTVLIVPTFCLGTFAASVTPTNTIPKAA